MVKTMKSYLTSLIQLQDLIFKALAVKELLYFGAEGQVVFDKTMTLLFLM